MVSMSSKSALVVTGSHSQLKQVRQQRAQVQVQLQQLKVQALRMIIRMALLIQMQRNQTHLQILNNKINPNKIHEDNNKIYKKTEDLFSVFCMQFFYGRILIFIKPNFLKIGRETTEQTKNCQSYLNRNLIPNTS